MAALDTSTRLALVLSTLEHRANMLRSSPFLCTRNQKGTLARYFTSGRWPEFSMTIVMFFALASNVVFAL